MKYVTLGKTGLKASIVSFGGIPIQRADAANTKAVVDKLEALPTDRSDRPMEPAGIISVEVVK